jgi:hypothetical protein
MTSVLKQLAGLSKESAEVTYTPPASITETEEMPLPTSAQELHEQTEELAEAVSNDAEIIASISNEIEDHAADIAKGADVAGAVENVVDQTIAAYGDNGIDEQGAALLTVSVESILIAAGINIPASMVVPSFEGKTRIEYSTEAEEKKQGFIQRIVDWIVKAFNSMVEALKNFWARIVASNKLLKAYAERVKAKVDGLEGHPTEAKVKMTIWGAACTTDGKSVHTPRENIKQNTTMLQAFTKAWDGAFGAIRDLNAPSSFASPEAMNSFLNEAVGSSAFKNGVQHLNGLKPTVTHTVEFKTGSDGQYPMAGAKYRLVKNEGEGPKEGPTLSLKDMDEGIDDVIRGLGLSDTIETKTKEWDKVVVRVRNFGSSIRFAQGFTPEGTKKLRGFAQTMVSSASIVSAGWSSVISSYNDVLKNNIRYISASAAQYKGKPSELKTVVAGSKDDQQKLGNDKNAA